MYRNFIYDKEYENGENLHFIVDVTEKTGSLYRRKLGSYPTTHNPIKYKSTKGLNITL